MTRFRKSRRAAPAALAAASATFAALAFLASPSGTRAYAAQAEVVPDVAACQGCHGADGISIGSAPHLAGQRAPYLAGQLQAFRSGGRQHELMNAIASQLDDDQINALAGYFSRLPREGTASDAERTAFALRPLITLPADFPQGFIVYRASDDAEAGTVTRTYANALAVDAARAGRPLPDGSMIVVENRRAQRTAEGMVMRTADGRLVPGEVANYSVSASASGWGDAIPALLRNGNWHYALFNAAREPQLRNQAQCLACHKPREADSFVFTIAELRAAPHQ